MKIINFNKKRFDSTSVIFLTVAVIYAIGNFIWWFIHTPIIPFDDSAVHFVDIFSDGYLFYNAPLVTYIMRFMFFMFGKEYYDLIIIFVNYIFFLIPLYFIYKIGVELKDTETGNIAMILFALVPAVYGMSRQYGHQDYHIIAGITFNIYCLIKTDYFKNKKWTIWYGISVGLGLMIKDAFLAYFFVPFVYIAIAGLREKIEKTKIINILISILIGSLIAGWHYFRPEIIIKVIKEPIIEQQPIFAFESLRVMTTGLWEELLSPPIFIIFIIGLIFFILKYKGKYKNIILLWFFVPWAIIMLMPHHKKPEYGVGFIPVMILIGAVFLSNIGKVYLKKILIFFLIIICYLQYIDFSYGTGPNLFDMQSKDKNNMFHYYNRNNPIISCNVKDTKLILNLIKYFKNHDSNRMFFVYDFTLIGKDKIMAQIFFSRIPDLHNAYKKEKIFFTKIGDLQNVRDTIESRITTYLERLMNVNNIGEKFKNKLINQTMQDFNFIINTKHINALLYLDEKTEECFE